MVGHITVDVLNAPELMALLRKEFAEIVRLGAEDEEPRVKARLLEFAAAFECGQKEDLPNG